METDLFLRENEKGLYCTSVYFLAKSLVGVIRFVLEFISSICGMRKSHYSLGTCHVINLV